MNLVPSIKGQSFVIARKYLVETFGESCLPQIYSLMPETDKLVASQTILPALWVGEKVFISFLSAAKKNFHQKNPLICQDIGYNSAILSIPKIYKIFIQLGNPGFVVARAPSFWKQIHNHGDFKVVENQAKTATGALSGYQTASKVFCEYLLGYFKGTIELSGVKGVVVTETKCVLEFGQFCQFCAKWE